MDDVGVSPAARGDDPVAALMALRDRLAAEIDLCDQPVVLAQLSREFRSVVSELAAARPKSLTRVDEIAQQYEKRLAVVRGAGAAGKGGSGGKRKSG